MALHSASEIVYRFRDKLDEYDLPMIQAEVESLLKKNWLVEDIIAYLSCLEEVNPSFDENQEADRIHKMQAIRAKYQAK